MDSSVAFDEKQALKVIENSLEISKRKISENGFILLLWGWLVIIGNLASYWWLLQRNGLAIGITWMVIGCIGGVVSTIYYAKKEKKEKVRSHLSSIITYVWAGVGAGAAIFYAYLIISKNFDLIGPFVLIAAGIATFITGRILRFTPMVIGAISFWAFAIAMFMLKPDWQFILGAVAMVPGYLVPGYILQAKAKKE